MNRYADPYVAGAGLGLVLTTAYVVTGHGIGASGAFATVAANATAAVIGPARVAASPATAPYLLGGPIALLGDWWVLEILGLVAGAFVSAWSAGRLRLTTERGPRINATQRTWTALVGGAAMGVGAKLARGCTSGQALTGGALLSVGSWIFIVACFAAAYAGAPLLRRLWR